MKTRVFVIFAATLLVCCLLLSGCSSEPYTSSYNAKGLVQTNTDSEATISFSEFQGVKVFKLKFNNGNTKSLVYSLRLEVGSAKIYYDTDGRKTELVSLKAGDSINENLKNLSCESMYIIIETGEKCLNGNFSFKAKVL